MADQLLRGSRSKLCDDISIMVHLAFGIRRGTDEQPYVAPRLLINVTQPLVLGIHDLEDRSVLEDSIRRHRHTELRSALGSATTQIWKSQEQILAHIQKRWTACRVFHVQPRLGVGTDRSSKERPEVLRVCVLPIIPDLVDHLGGCQLELLNQR